MVFPDPVIDQLGPARVVQGPHPKRRQRYLDIFGADGQAARFCHDRTLTFTSAPMASHIDDLPPQMREPAGPVTQGPVLYAGLSNDQFGFAILQSLGRLWACDRLPPETKLLFLSRGAPRKTVNTLNALLGWLGLRNTPIFVRGNMQLTDAYTCPNLFGETYDGHAAPSFCDWLETRLPTAPDMVAGRKLYVTRARLGPLFGRTACEDHLEDLLRRDGFEIYAPEAHSLAEQTNAYRQAETLVFAEGSAQHFFGLVKRPGQRVAVIQRRPEIPPLLRNQTTAMNPEPVRYINAIEALHWPPDRADNRAICQIDFDRLRADLVAGQFLSADAAWFPPTPDAIARSIQAGLQPGERLYPSHAEAIAQWKRLRDARRAGS